MSTLLPRDANNEEIPVLGWKPSSGQTIAVGTSQNRNGAAFADETNIVSLWSTVPFRIRQGGSTVVADSTDPILPANILHDISIGGGANTKKPYISVISYDGSTTGSVYLGERT